MAISVVSAVPLSATVIRVTFSEPYAQSGAVFEKSNYAFRTRFGDDIPIYTSGVLSSSATAVDVTLRDAMLDGGNYEIAVHGVAAQSDGVPIEEGPGPATAFFVGVGEPFIRFSLLKRIQTWFKTTFGSNVSAGLGGVASALHKLAGRSETSELRKAQRALLLRTADANDLDVIGANYGVTRPDFAVNDDDLFRKLIPILGTRKKSVLGIFHEALTAVFGPRSEAGWAIFEIEPNELIIELPPDLFFGLAPGGVDVSTYFHDMDQGNASAVGTGTLTDSSKAWTVDQWVGALLYDGQRAEGTSTGVGTGTLTDSGQSWTTNEWAGRILTDSAGSAFTVVSNTATVLTVSGGNPVAGFYTITGKQFTVLSNTATVLTVSGGNPTTGRYNVLFSEANTYDGDYFLEDEADDGSDVDDNIIVMFQQTVIEDVVNKLKASGIEIHVEVRE